MDISGLTYRPAAKNEVNQIISECAGMSTQVRSYDIVFGGTDAPGPIEVIEREKGAGRFAHCWGDHPELGEVHLFLDRAERTDVAHLLYNDARFIAGA